MTSTDDALQTARLLLRPFSATDAEEVFGGITPTLTRYMAFEPPASKTAFEAIWREWIHAMHAGTECTFVIRQRHTGRFIGIVALHGATEHEPELGIWVHEREHGQGYGREAVAAVVHWGDARHSPAAYRYPVAEDNAASRRLAEGLGGQVIGTETATKFASVIYRIPAPLAARD